MSAELRRTLTLYGLIMIAVGSTIGSGIFRTPGKIALLVHMPEFVIMLWVLGGVVALTGALTLAEMGSMFPGAGGLYVYLREAYGDGMGFLYGWFILFVSTSGSIAALAVVCSEHMLYLGGVGRDSGWVMPLAVFLIVFLTVVNLFGVKIGEWIANIFTTAKLVGLALIIGAGWFFANQEVPQINETSAFANEMPSNLASAFAVAFIGVLWSYGGWHHVSFMAGEAKDPQRTVPRAMMIGAGIVTLVYVLANIAYMRLLPIEQLANSKTVAADAMSTVFPSGGNLMAFLIALSTFGTTGIYCMTAPRIYYAMAKDGVFFPKLAEVHPKWRTPVWAILAQSAWALFLLAFWGTFEDLIEYVTFMDWLAMMMVGTTIFIFRKKLPDTVRGYRTIGFPVTPIVFIAICLWFVLFNLVESWEKAVAGLVVALVGWLAFSLYFKKNKLPGNTD
ncbi:MAG: amino acid permease [Saprospiraceae bacterium]|nr:amino acid permease [Saprospiraceae bacterium]